MMKENKTIVMQYTERWFFFFFAEGLIDGQNQMPFY